MSRQLIVAALVFFASCKSGTKDEPTVKNETIDSPAIPKTDTTNTATNTNPPPHGKIDIETFGDIKIGQASSETIKAIGEPDTKSKATEWEADGMMHEDWTYKAKGLVLNMASEVKSKDNSKTIFSINAAAPCTFKTRANMGIGNSYDEVKQSYTRDIDSTSTTKTQIVVGSVYGGIVFGFKNDKVQTIFLGAAAE